MNESDIAYYMGKTCNFSISAGTAFWIPASAGMTQRISEVQHVIPAEAGIQAFRNVRIAHRY